MPDFQEQFIPDNRNLICKRTLTTELDFDNGDNKDASSDEE